VVFSVSHVSSRSRPPGRYRYCFRCPPNSVTARSPRAVPLGKSLCMASTRTPPSLARWAGRRKLKTPRSAASGALAAAGGSGASKSGGDTIGTTEGRRMQPVGRHRHRPGESLSVVEDGLERGARPDLRREEDGPEDGHPSGRQLPLWRHRLRRRILLPGEEGARGVAVGCEGGGEEWGKGKRCSQHLPTTA